MITKGLEANREWLESIGLGEELILPTEKTEGRGPEVSQQISIGEENFIPVSRGCIHPSRWLTYFGGLE